MASTSNSSTQRNPKKETIQKFYTDSRTLVDKVRNVTSKEELLNVVKKNKDLYITYLRVKNGFDDFKKSMRKYEEENKILSEEDKNVESIVGANLATFVDVVKPFTDGESVDDYLRDVFSQ